MIANRFVFCFFFLNIDNQNAVIIWKTPEVYSASHKFWNCTKKNSKKLNKFFLFKVITTNCNTLVGAIFQRMHYSRKISNRNSLQFRSYKCLNVAYGCILVPLQLYFQLWKNKIVGWTQIKRVRGWLSLSRTQQTAYIVLLSIHMAQIVHTVFVFSNHQTECGERWFSVSHTHGYHPTTSKVIVLPNSCHPSDVFVCFCCFRPSAPLCIFNRLLNRHKPAMPSKYCSTQHARVTERFYKYFHVFTAVNPALEQNFIAVRCSKFSPWYL